MARAGRTVSAINAKIFPPRTLVNSGRKAVSSPRTAAMAVKDMRMSGVLFIRGQRLRTPPQAAVQNFQTADDETRGLASRLGERPVIFDQLLNHIVS